MQIIRSLNDIPHNIHCACVTIGNFDGVHLGHRKLFSRVIELAARCGGTSIAVTFDPHPLEVLRPDGVKRISTMQRKIELIEGAGIEILILIPFTREFAATGADEFVQKILVGKLGVKELVIGYDYAFGRGRSGDISFLREQGERYGFAVSVVPPFQLYGQPVSSTRIRELVAEGRIDLAGELLGRPWQIRGAVQRGQNRGGAELGFPTANLQFSGEELVPRYGVYACRVLLRGKEYGGVANIGRNPTFKEGLLVAETFIFDFKDDIYGEEIVISLLKYLRGEVRFESIDALRTQISADVKEAKCILASRA